MSCCSGKSKNLRPHINSCNECFKEGKCCRKPRFCVSNCTEKKTCNVCACAKSGEIIAPGVELKLPSVEGATYFWTLCSPPFADCSLDCVQGQNCITRFPSLRGLEGLEFDENGAYKEIKYVGHVVKHDESILQKEFHVFVFDISCQPCDYIVKPSDCLIDESCPEVTIEYCGSNFGIFDPTGLDADVDFTDTGNWTLNGIQQTGSKGNPFSEEEVTVTKPCETASFTHRKIVVRLDKLDPSIENGRNELRFELENISGMELLSISVFLVKCPSF